MTRKSDATRALAPGPRASRNAGRQSLRPRQLEPAVFIVPGSFWRWACRWLSCVAGFGLGGVQNWMSADLWRFPAPDADARRGRCASDDRVRDPYRVAGYPLSASHLPDACGAHLYHQLAAGRRHGAGAGHRHHSLRPSGYQTEIYPFLCHHLLMFMPRALINLRAGIAQAPVELENVAQPGQHAREGALERDDAGWPRRAAGMPRWFSRRQQRVDRHAAVLSAGHARAPPILGADQ